MIHYFWNVHLNKKQMENQTTQTNAENPKKEWVAPQMEVIEVNSGVGGGGDDAMRS